MFNPPSNPYALLTYQDVCAWLSITARALRRWIDTGRFPKPRNYNGQKRWTWGTCVAWAELHGTEISADRSGQQAPPTGQQAPPRRKGASQPENLG